MATKSLSHHLLRAVVLGMAFLLSGQAGAAERCDRACMSALLTNYVDALIAHDPARLPLAERVRFTEDSREMKLGEGLWQTVTAKGKFRHDFLDARAQVAAAHMQLFEGTNQVLLSVVLHLQERTITGIETLVQRVTPESRMQPKELGQPIRGLDDPVPAGKRQSRDAMIRTALTYTEGLRIGNFTDARTPFAPETYRVENGVILAGTGCGRDDCGLYTQNITLHPGIIASVAAVDEENGVVLLWMNFGHTGSQYGEGNALVTFEAFKVWGGEIHTISAFFTSKPISTARFWPSSDPVPK